MSKRVMFHAILLLFVNLLPLLWINGSEAAELEGITGKTVTSSASYAKVTLLSPNGGESFAAGSMYHITWGAPAAATKFDLAYSLNSGKTWKTIATNISGSSYDWTVLPQNANRTNCLIKVTGYDSGGILIGTDQSDARFTIQVIKVNSPDGGESLNSGTTHPITWATYATTKPVAKINLYYKSDSTGYHLITSFTGSNPGLYNWTVPTVTTSKKACRVKVELKDSVGKTAGMDTSNLNFTINPAIPEITLVSIAVTPASPVITQGATRQFTATGSYSDSSSADITSSALWSSSETSVATIDSTGLASTGSAGTAVITAKADGISGNTLLTVTAAASQQPPINITMDLHCDPLNQQLTLDERRTFFRRQVSNATWLMNFLGPYGVRVSFLATGECYEFCLEESEQAACLPLLVRLQTSGGILGTHSHTEYRRGWHDWPTIANAYTNPASADVRMVWDTNKQSTDEAIRLALGLSDLSAIAGVNSASESHAQLSDPNQLMEEYGYTIREGGADQIMASYFSHVPWNPFRPGQTAIMEDLTTKFVTIPQGMVIGHTGEHLGRWQDGTAARKKAEFLQLYANWKEINRRGSIPKVWAFGWGVHTQDLDEGSESRTAIEDLIPWLHDEFVTKSDSTGNPPARFASYIDVRDEYLAWEAEHSGVSSFNYASATTDYSQYPYLEWANRYLRFARLDSRIAASGADLFLMKAGDYSITGPATYPFALAVTGGPSVTIDLSSALGAGDLKSIKLSNGSVSSVPAGAVSLFTEPAVFCSPVNCAAILALENASSGTPCGSTVCTTGQVCATDVNICVPDCRKQGFICPAARPMCNVITGVCR